MANRVALVTGGNGGIGVEICKMLVSAGHRVVSTCIDPDGEDIRGWQQSMREAGYPVDWVVCDVSDSDACAAMASQVTQEFGPVEVLVNVAGITRDAFLHKMDSENWSAVMSTNLDGVYNVTRQFIGRMRDNGFGRVINISSVNGQTGQFGQTNYSAAKAGIHGFTMALAKESAPKGVTVNSISPGYVRTSMTDAIPERVREDIIDQIPAGRLAEPWEIARVVVFLAAEEAGYINGANIPVNGALFCSF